MVLAEILCAAVLAFGVGDTSTNGEFACKHMNHVISEAQKNNLKPELLVSLIHYESRWTPGAVSRSNACGLTQVIPKWTGGKASGKVKYTCDQLKNPRTSITAGAKILSHWIKYYGKGNVKTGLCGYNAGYRCLGPDANKSGLLYARKITRLSRKISAFIKKEKNEKR